MTPRRNGHRFAIGFVAVVLLGAVIGGIVVAGDALPSGARAATTPLLSEGEQLVDPVEADGGYVARVRMRRDDQDGTVGGLGAQYMVMCRSSATGKAFRSDEAEVLRSRVDFPRRACSLKPAPRLSR